MKKRLEDMNKKKEPKFWSYKRFVIFSAIFIFFSIGYLTAGPTNTIIMYTLLGIIALIICIILFKEIRDRKFFKRN